MGAPIGEIGGMPSQTSTHDLIADSPRNHLQLRVGRYTPRDGMLEYRIDLSGGYEAVVTKLMSRWRLVVHGGTESDLGMFNSAAEAFVKLEEFELLRDARRHK